MPIVVDIRDDVTGLVQDVEAALQPAHLNPKIGAAEVRLFQDHFAQLPNNRRGWPSGHYWGQAAKSMHYTLLADGVSVSSSLPGLNMHVTGLPAVIRPINAKNLAIPAVAAAYGRSPREFTNLRLAFHRVGGSMQAYALVQGSGEQPLKTRSARGERRSGHRAKTGEVIFWLVKEVHPRKYPGVIPSEDEMRATAIEVAQQAIDQIKARREKG